METEEGIEFAERLEAIYDCPSGHTVILPLYVEAEAPEHWQCRCGQVGLLRQPDGTKLPPVKRQRTHWDMLLERRSVEDLEELLNERLELLRKGQARLGVRL